MPTIRPQHRDRAGRRPLRLPALLVALGCAALAGCQSRTDVSATGNTPAQYTHVFLTITQIWFNTSSTAPPSDPSWVKFTLATPQTVDLVNLDNGALSQFASDLKLATGTYARVTMILADSTQAVTAAAQAAGAASNDEVDYVDAADVLHTVPLAVLNAAQGIGISTSLTVAAATSSLGGDSSSTTDAATQLQPH